MSLPRSQKQKLKKKKKNEKIHIFIYLKDNWEIIIFALEQEKLRKFLSSVIINFNEYFISLNVWFELLQNQQLSWSIYLSIYLSI